MTMASTEAKIGRSMKKLTNTRSAPGGRRQRLEGRLHAHPGPNLLQALDHNPLARLHALVDDPQRPEAGSQPHGARLHGLIRPDHEQGGRALTLLDRRLGHDDRLPVLEEDPQARVLSRAEPP